MNTFKFSLLGLLVAQCVAGQVSAVDFDVPDAVNSSTSMPIWSGTYNATVANAISGGSLRFYGVTILNAQAAHSISGGEQYFWDSSALNFTVSGAGTGGQRWFLGNNTVTASAADAIVGGYHDFRNAGRLNVLAANAISGGIYNFNQTSSLYLSAGISSNQVVVGLLGAGTHFFLNGHSALIGNLTGAGTVQNGDLVIDSTLGSSAFNGRLTDGAGQLALTKQGDGTWTYNGDGSGMTGATEVIGGTLVVNGNLSNSAITVYDGAALLSGGSLGATVVKDGGRLGAGATWGPSVKNALTFEKGSLFDVAIMADGRNDGVKVNGAGTVTLEGGTVRVTSRPGDYMVGTRYTLLSTTGAVTGTFDRVEDDLAFLDAKLVYSDPTKVDLLLARNGLSFADIAVTDEQRDTANGIASSGDKNLASLIEALDAETARSAYNQLAGEAHATALTALTDDQEFVRRGMSNRLYQGAGQGAGQGWWSKTEGDSTRADGTAHADSVSKRRRSVLLGFDRQLLDTAWRLGLLGGYSHSALNTCGADIKVDTFHLGTYAGTAYNKVQVRLGASANFSQVDSKRVIAFGVHRGKETSDYTATGVQGFAELGYKAAVGTLAVEPFINLAGVSVQRDNVKEKGDAAALQSDSKSTFTTFTTLGTRARHSFTLGDRAVELAGSIGLRHAQGDVTPVSDNRFVVGGDHFSVEGSPLAKNTLVYQAGVNTALGHGVTLGVGYAGQSAKDSQSHGGQVEVKWAF